MNASRPRQTNGSYTVPIGRSGWPWSSPAKQPAALLGPAAGGGRRIEPVPFGLEGEAELGAEGGDLIGREEGGMVAGVAGDGKAEPFDGVREDDAGPVADGVAGLVGGEY